VAIRTSVGTGFAIAQIEAGLADNEGFALIRQVGDASTAIPISINVEFHTIRLRRRIAICFSKSSSGSA